MSKHKLLPHSFRPAAHVVQPLPVPLNCSAELRPRNTAHIPTLPPRLFFGLLRVTVRSDFIVKPGNHLLAAVHPLVPVVPNGWAASALFIVKLDVFVELAHALGDLLGCFWDAEVARGEGHGMVVLFETAILERTQDGRADVFLSQAAESAEFMFTVNQVFDLGAVDAQEKFTRLRQYDDVEHSGG